MVLIINGWGILISCFLFKNFVVLLFSKKNFFIYVNHNTNLQQQVENNKKTGAEYSEIIYSRCECSCINTCMYINLYINFLKLICFCCSLNRDA